MIWNNSFEKFLEDVGEIPIGLTLDRIKNNKGYEPGNVRYATSKQQSRNRTNNRIIEYNGEEKCLSEWAEEFRISPITLTRRLNMGWTIDRALNAPTQKYNEVILFNGQEKKLTEWAKDLGMSRNTLYTRINIAKTPIHIALTAPLQTSPHKKCLTV